MGEVLGMDQNEPLEARVINSFKGKYAFLSNFWPCQIVDGGLTFPSVEHAYQAAKCADPKLKVGFTSGTAANVKKRGRHVKIRHDWDSIKLHLMELLVRQKFHQHEHLKKDLLATGDAILIEGNWWGDRFWGVYNGVGENHLGKILMKVRKEFRLGVE